MKKVLTSGVLIFLGCIFFVAQNAYSINFGYLRALQKGPIGDSLGYTTIDKYEPEGVIAIGNASGTQDVNSADNKLKSSATKFRAAAGGGIAISREFMAAAHADVNINDYDDEAKDPVKTELSCGYNTYELAVNIAYKPDPVVIGGSIGTVLIGGETREFQWDNGTYKHDISSAAMPVIQLYGGLALKEFFLTGGFRLFSQGNAEVETKDNSGENKITYDIARRYPGELHVDGRISAIDDVDIGFGIAYVLTGQASEEIDEFSVRYDDVNGKRVRITGGEKRNANHLRIGGGARIAPSSMVDILAGMQYIMPSYNKVEYATLEHENMGGFKLDLGTDVTVMKRIRGFAQIGYFISSGADYTVKGDSRVATYVDQMQRPPVADGDKVKLSQTMWMLSAGGSYKF